MEKSCKVGLLTLILGGWLFLAVSPPAEGALKWGVRAGYTRGQLRAEEGDSGFDVEKFALAGMAFGLTANIPVTSFFALQPEILYFQKGGAYDVGVPVGIPGISVNVHDTRSLAYIEVPLMLKFMIPLRGPFRPTFLVGPSLGFNLSGKLKGKIEIDVPGLSFSFNETKDLKKELNDVEFSFVVGGGFDLDLGRGVLLVDNRFFFGLKTNGFKVVVPASKFAALGFPAMEDFGYDLNMFNYVMSISVGYLF